MPVRSPLLALALVLAACGPADRGSCRFGARDERRREQRRARTGQPRAADPARGRRGARVRLSASRHGRVERRRGAGAGARPRVRRGGRGDLARRRARAAGADRLPAGRGEHRDQDEAHRTRVERRLHHLRDHRRRRRWSATRASGTWKWKPPVAARAVFPQPDASLLVLGERAGGSVRLAGASAEHAHRRLGRAAARRPRAPHAGGRPALPRDRSASSPACARGRMQRTASVAFDEPVELLAATPSGDRVFVVTSTGTSVQIVDRYRETRRAASIDLGRHPSDLRMDPLGRYLLARLDGVDSAAVIALGTNRVVGTARDGLARRPPLRRAGRRDRARAGRRTSSSPTATTLRPTARVSGGAADFWYPFRWTGFRPRAEALDEPVDFVGPPVDSTASRPIPPHRRTRRRRPPRRRRSRARAAAARHGRPSPARGLHGIVRRAARRRQGARARGADPRRQRERARRHGRCATARRSTASCSAPIPRAKKPSASGASRSSPTGSTRADRERDAHDGLERGGPPHRRDARRVPRDRRRRHRSDRDRRGGARHRARAGGAPPRRGRRPARRRAAASRRS